ncbi:MAG TPA: sigma 54-interacting transcriptional regulator [Acidobacteriota bacterium]|nr:sigma 54-interacting transcriptional regulator [Acidobacteriota bacterium]
MDASSLLSLLSTQTSLERLIPAAIDLALDQTGAARGFLMLREDNGEIMIRAGRTSGRDDLSGDDFTGSHSIVKKVLEEKQPLFIPALPADVSFSQAPSVRAGSLQSVICIPLFRPGDPTSLLGLLYVDSTTPVRPLLTEEHLSVLQGLASYVAVSVENARMFAEIERKNAEIAALNKRLEERVELQEGKLQEMETLLGDSQKELGRLYGLGNIIGKSPLMQSVFRILEKVSQTHATVLVQGESGTGKELIARHIHFNSPRARKPIVSVNCAALNDTLLESELFGHRKGAFTGADHHRVGVFQLADGGTLFLDEVGDMSLEMQKKLLRVLQNGEVRPIGSEETHHVDVRIIAASNRDLKTLVADGKFREDLYFRLNVLLIQLPRLRDRREDLPLLIRHLTDRISAELAKPLEPPPGKMMDRFLEYEWPGNVRELENELRRYFILESEYRPDQLGGVGTGSQTFDLNSVERETIRKALDASQGNKTRAAELLGIPLRTLYDRLKKYGLG